MWSEREEREKGQGYPGGLSVLRDAFVRISSVIVNAKDADALVAKLMNERLADPSGHETMDWTDGPFFMEYPWRNTWDSSSGYMEDGWRPFEGFKYFRTVARCVSESHLDASLSDGFSTCVPSPWIGREFGVKPDLNQIGECRNQAGDIVFIDPAYAIDRISSCLADPGLFFAFLERNGLECIWIVAGERNAYPSGQHGDYHCRTFAGLHRFSNGHWKSEEWHSDTSRHGGSNNPTNPTSEEYSD